MCLLWSIRFLVKLSVAVKIKEKLCWSSLEQFRYFDECFYLALDKTTFFFFSKGSLWSDLQLSFLITTVMFTSLSVVAIGHCFYVVPKLAMFVICFTFYLLMEFTDNEINLLLKRLPFYNVWKCASGELFDVYLEQGRVASHIYMVQCRILNPNALSAVRNAATLLPSWLFLGMKMNHCDAHKCKRVLVY